MRSISGSRAKDFRAYEIVIPALIRKLEYVVLNHAETSWTVPDQLRMGKTAADVEIERRPVSRLDDSERLSTFLRLRTAVFAAILSQPRTRGASVDDAHTAGIVETTDVTPLADLIDEYLQAFVDLTTTVYDPTADPDHRVNGMSGLAAIDTVELRWRKPGGGNDRAVLLAPTHPVRLAWSARHATQAAKLIEAWDGGREAHDWQRIIDQFLALRPT